MWSRFLYIKLCDNTQFYLSHLNKNSKRRGREKKLLQVTIRMWVSSHCVKRCLAVALISSDRMSAFDKRNGNFNRKHLVLLTSCHSINSLKTVIEVFIHMYIIYYRFFLIFRFVSFEWHQYLMQWIYAAIKLLIIYWDVLYVCYLFSNRFGSLKKHFYLWIIIIIIYLLMDRLSVVVNSIAIGLRVVSTRRVSLIIMWPWKSLFKWG